jgi:hypothetical protein
MERVFKTNIENELRLNKHGVHTIGDYQPGTVIFCQMGILWVTQTDKLEDTILLAGEQFTSRQRGKVLIEAMRDSVARIGTGEERVFGRRSSLSQGKPIY